MKPTIFFDLDGVLADFVRGSFRLHGRSLPIRDVRWDYPPQMGFSSTNDPAFWAPMDRAFWAGLGRHEDGFTLLGQVTRMVPPEQIGLLTSAASEPGCIDGKRDWVRQHLPDYLPRLFTGSAKQLFAAPSKILVDDHDQNASRFREAGGHSVLVPRPWNARAHLCDAEGSFLVSQCVDDMRNLLWAIAGTS